MRTLAHLVSDDDEEATDTAVWALGPTPSPPGGSLGSLTDPGDSFSPSPTLNNQGRRPIQS